MEKNAKINRGKEKKFADSARDSCNQLHAKKTSLEIITHLVKDRANCKELSLWCNEWPPNFPRDLSVFCNMITRIKHSHTHPHKIFKILVMPFVHACSTSVFRGIFGTPDWGHTVRKTTYDLCPTFVGSVVFKLASHLRRTQPQPRKITHGCERCRMTLSSQN